MAYLFVLAIILLCFLTCVLEGKVVRIVKDIDTLKSLNESLEEDIIRLQKKNKTLENAIKSMSKKEYMLKAEKKVES